MINRRELEQKLIEKALGDEAFKKLLLDNPAAAIESETGIKIPELFKVKTLIEDNRSFYIVIPYVQNENEEVELTEKELEAMSGGGGDCNSMMDIIL